MKVKNCHLCKSEDLELILSLPPTPPANELLSDRFAKQEEFPLDLYQCNDCQHFQLLDVVDPERLYKNYVYVSGTSPAFVRHFRNYACDLISNFNPSPTNLIVDIGSNDGTLLKHFKNLGLRVLGVDPAEAIAKKATQEGIETLPKFFNLETAKEIVKSHGKAKIITCNNCFAHTADLNTIVEGMKELLTDDGIISIEVQYFKNLLDNTYFDMIYHEHLHYWTFNSLDVFMSKHELELMGGTYVDTHGGSIRCLFKRKNAIILGTHYMDYFSFDEQIDNSLSLFKKKIKKAEDDFSKWFDEAYEKERSYKPFVGYGAPAKLTTLIHYFNINANMMNYVCDDSPWKQGLYTPSGNDVMRFKIEPSTKLYEDQPKYCIIFAWNFADSIIKKCRENGYKGKFVIPLPELRIVE